MTSNHNADGTKDAFDQVAHSAEADQARGRRKELMGAARATVGNLIGDTEMEANGRLQQAEGKAVRLKGEIKEKIEDARDHIQAGVEAVKDKVDALRRR